MATSTHPHTSETALIDHLRTLNLGSDALQQDNYLTMDIINKTFDGTSNPP